MKSRTMLGGVLVLLSLAGGCSSSKKGSGDPLLDVANRELAARARAEAVPLAQTQALADGGRAQSTRRVFKDIAWTTSEPPLLRMEVLGALLHDPDPKVAADAREMAKLMLPKERSLAVVIYLSRIATDQGWTDAVPALVRSYSRTREALNWTGGIKEEERPERAAIVALSGNRPIEEIVFEVFLNPPKVEDSYGMDWAMRFRSDAWDLLARLDPDGSRRLAMINGLPEGSGDEVVANIRKSVKDLRAIPLTGEELRWVNRLADPKKSANAAWWDQAAKAIAKAGERGMLNVRHAEAIRWVSVTRPEWLSSSREELLSLLKQRFGGRTIHLREAEDTRYRVREVLDHWAPKLQWADLLVILVVDDVVRQPSIVKAIAAQAELDRRDTTTEYGGAIARKNIGIGAVTREDWVAMLYPPRPGQRQGDERFVASDDMVNASDLALVHYHLHVQKERNNEYAGPSPGDLLYSARSGRTCVVFTSVGKGGRMNVDLYQPDGAVIDLGEVAPPAPEVDSGMQHGVGPR